MLTNHSPPKQPQQQQQPSTTPKHCSTAPKEPSAQRLDSSPINMGGGYLVQNPLISYNCNNNNGSSSINSTSRHDPATSKAQEWLLSNFEECKHVNLSREAIYTDYMEHFSSQSQLQQQQQPIVNSARLGKLVRLLFPGVKSRRLGVRGRSKYHYHGIGIKSTSELANSNSASMKSYRDARLLEESNGESCLNASNNVIDIDGHADSHQPKENPSLFIQLDPFRPPIPTAIDGSEMESSLLYARLVSYCQSVCDALNAADLYKLELQFTDYGRSVLNQDSTLILPAATKVIIDFDILLFSSILNSIELYGHLNIIANVSFATIRQLAESIELWTMFSAEPMPEYLKMPKQQVARAFAVALKKLISFIQLSNQTNELITCNQKMRQSMIKDWRLINSVHVQPTIISSFKLDSNSHWLEELKSDINTKLLDSDSFPAWQEWIETFLTKHVRASENINNAANVELDITGYEMNGKDLTLKLNFYFSRIIRQLAVGNSKRLAEWQLLFYFIDEFVSRELNNRISSHKRQHLARNHPDQAHFAFMNLSLFFQLNQRNYFAPPISLSTQSPVILPLPRPPSSFSLVGNNNNAASHQSASISGTTTPSLYSLSRIPSMNELMSVLSRGNADLSKHAHQA